MKATVLESDYIYVVHSSADAPLADHGKLVLRIDADALPVQPVGSPPLKDEAYEHLSAFGDGYSSRHGVTRDKPYSESPLHCLDAHLEREGDHWLLKLDFKPNEERLRAWDQRVADHQLWLKRKRLEWDEDVKRAAATQALPGGPVVAASTEPNLDKAADAAAAIISALKGLSEKERDRAIGAAVEFHDPGAQLLVTTGRSDYHALPRGAQQFGGMVFDDPPTNGEEDDTFEDIG